MFYTRTLSHFYGPFHIFICFVEKQSFIVWIGRTLISGHNTAANFQTNKPGNRKSSLPFTSFQNIPHTISKRLTLRSVKLPFQILFCMRLACRQHLWCKTEVSAWAFSRLQAVMRRRHGFWLMRLVVFEFRAIFYTTIPEWKHCCWSQQ